jgi:hypothetical protein
MASIGETYRKFLQERIIKDYLVSGVIPSKPEVDRKVSEIEKTNRGLNQPFTSESQYHVGEFESSSAKKINNTFDILRDDLSVLYTCLIDQAALITDIFDSVNGEISLLKKKASELEEKAAALLFFAPDSAGSLDFVSDYFQNKNKIDLLKSTCLVDASSARVMLPVNKFSRIGLSLLPQDVQFSVITRADYVSDSLAPQSDLLNAFNELDKIWLQRVVMSKGTNAVTAELILRVPQGPVEVNRIIFSPASSDEGNIATVTVQYSQDGLSWTNLTGENSARLIGDATIAFQAVKAAYWKFIFNKAGYDDFRKDLYTYEFGMKSIQLYGIEYSNKEKETKGTLVTKPLVPESGVEFNKVSLSVCEVIPKGSRINYYIAGLSSQELNLYNSGQLGFSSLAFIAVDPVERKDKSNLSFVDFAKTNPESGFNSSIQIDNSVEFRNKTINDFALDYEITNSVIKNQIKVLRNIGSNASVNSISGLDSGWSLENSFYKTSFYISEEAGKEINLGTTQAIIDGSAATGRITLSAGYHTFSTHRDNWRKVSFIEIQNDSVADPLYPYNHKYIIEGIHDNLYGQDLELTLGGKSYWDIIDPDRVYSGVSVYWSKTLEPITFFEFSSNTGKDNYGVYSIAKDFNGIERILVKQSVEPSLMSDENFAIITRSVNGDLRKALILKADFFTDDPKLTPILDEYVIKLGY